MTMRESTGLYQQMFRYQSQFAAHNAAQFIGQTL